MTKLATCILLIMSDCNSGIVCVRLDRRQCITSPITRFIAVVVDYQIASVVVLYMTHRLGRQHSLFKCKLY